MFPDFVVFPASWSGADASHLPALNPSSTHALHCFRPICSIIRLPRKYGFHILKSYILAVLHIYPALPLPGIFFPGTSLSFLAGFFCAFFRRDPDIPERHIPEVIFFFLEPAQFHRLAGLHALFRFVELAAGDVDVCEAAVRKYRRVRPCDAVVVVANGMEEQAGHDAVCGMDLFYIASALSCGLDLDPVGGVFEVTVPDPDVPDAAGHLAPQSEPVPELADAVKDPYVFAWPVDDISFRVFARLDGHRVVSKVQPKITQFLDESGSQPSPFQIFRDWKWHP